MYLAYARRLQEQTQAGVPVRLVVISLRDWSAGKLMEDRAGVVRLVVPPSAPLADLDWSPLFALDVLVIGGEMAEMTAVLRLCLAAGASTVWGDYDEGFARVDACRIGGVVSDQVVAHIDALLEVLPGIRTARLLTGAGVFCGLMFREARIAVYGALLGPRVADRLRARFGEQVAA